jgi:hypothetical protein
VGLAGELAVARLPAGEATVRAAPKALPEDDVPIHQPVSLQRLHIVHNLKDLVAGECRT